MTIAHRSPTQQKQRDAEEWLWPMGISLALSLAMVAPYFWLGTASGHDFEFHAASWLDAAYQWKEGILYPRWTAWTNHGFGEPRFIFYPPLSWMLGAVLTLLLPGRMVPIFFIVLVQTLAGLSAYLLLRRLAARPAALLASACYVINPNALLMTYIRSDFAEQLACAIFPLLLLAALRLCELLDDSRPRPSSMALFALPFAAVWLSNAPAGVIASYAMTLLMIWAALEQRSWRVLARGAAAITLGFGLASFYLVPAAYEQRWVNIGQALSSGLLPVENFLFTAIDDVEHTWFNWIASFCALCVILLFAVAALCSRRFARVFSDRRQAAFTALLVVGSAAALLTLRFTLPLWKLLPKLRFVQFPWRCMSIVGLVCACFLAALMEKRRGWAWFVSILVLSVPLTRFLVINTWWDADEMATIGEGIESGHGFDGTDEYDPVGDDHLDLPSEAPPAKALPGETEEWPRAEVLVHIRHWTTEDKEVQVEAQKPVRVALRLLNYPAWRVEVNGKAVRPERIDDVNQMVVPVGAGNARIHVRFLRTTDRKAGNAISFVSLLIVAALLRKKWPDPARLEDPSGGREQAARETQRRSIEG